MQGELLSFWTTTPKANDKVLSLRFRRRKGMRWYLSSMVQQVFEPDPKVPKGEAENKRNSKWLEQCEQRDEGWKTPGWLGKLGADESSWGRECGDTVGDEAGNAGWAPGPTNLLQRQDMGTSFYRTCMVAAEGCFLYLLFVFFFIKPIGYLHYI